MSTNLSLQVLNLTVLLRTLLLELVEAMVFALKGLSLLLNEELQVLLVVQNLLDVLLDRADEKLVLFVSLLHTGVLLL